MKFLFLFFLVHSGLAQEQDKLIDIATVNPSIKVEMRYLDKWNFMGDPVAGYFANKCFLSKKAATALSLVNDDLESRGYQLLLFDCYRPQKAVDHFVEWVKVIQDVRMKKIFYPAEPKATLIARGYIADKSGHSRGSTIDLTVIKKTAVNQSYRENVSDCRKTQGIESTGQLDMGTTFDCFSSLAQTINSQISKSAQKNRLILKNAMEKFGFKNYSKEWWHYTLINEPYPSEYFNFDIK